MAREGGSIGHTQRPLAAEIYLVSTCCSNYCMLAYHRNVVEKRKKRLIVLMMLENPTDLYANDASDMVTLRLYLRQYTYIDYQADNWLDRLLYALPIRGLLQLNEHDNHGDNVALVENIANTVEYRASTSQVRFR